MHLCVPAYACASRVAATKEGDGVVKVVRDVVMGGGDDGNQGQGMIEISGQVWQQSAPADDQGTGIKAAT